MGERAGTGRTQNAGTGQVMGGNPKCVREATMWGRRGGVGGDGGVRQLGLGMVVTTLLNK